MYAAKRPLGRTPVLISILNVTAQAAVDIPPEIGSTVFLYADSAFYGAFAFGL